MSDIRFDDVSRVYGQGQGRFVALDGVSLRVADKEFVAIVGPSGCGKTTLLRLAAGLDFPSGGGVSVGGRSVTGPGPDRAVVFQQFALFPWKTVAGNIGFGLKSAGRSRADIARAVARFVAMMGLQGHEAAYPHQLSGGMQQRVAIARSYVLEPGVLLMDEPFGALDAQTRLTMQAELVRLARTIPRTVLFITHAVEEAVYLADRVVVMSRKPGRIREIVDIAAARKAAGWGDLPIEDVMELEGFVHLRAHVARLLHDTPQ